ncbi:hypothetical protein HNQ56_002689 [Anaerotaenia torta]|uniref:pyridoxamine 5'-phosphate oxidase family protein n=1 Tax=Anaerotaenia torta TaxID=433293 RepID=UPI003D1BF5F4
MRRKDREITDLDEIYGIIRKCDVCRLAFHNDKYPYIVPMNFGVIFNEEGFKLYFHATLESTKLELLGRNPKVAFEMDCSHNLITGEDACSYTMEYESVCGNGELRAVEEEEKVLGLTAPMEQYQREKEFHFSEKMINRIAVLELTVDEITGKRLRKER